jgi:hypothetical protein
MAALKDALSELKNLSRQLNDESDSVNELISSVERSINEASPGVAVWPHRTTMGFLEANETVHDERNGSALEWRTYWEIGYGKHGDGWRILARQMAINLDDDDSDGGQLWSDAQPLLDCSRSVRAAAAPHLETLVYDIRCRVEQTLKGLRDAKARAT